MRTVKRSAIFFLFLFICLPFLAVEVFANAPPDTELTGELGFPLWFDIIFVILISVPGVLLTIISESWVAGAFRMGARERKCIRWTNFASQLLLRTAHIAVTAGLSVGYLTSILILEIAVYIGEFLVYRGIMKDIPAKKLLLYTLTANTVSLLLGILINDIVLFHQ